MSPPGRVATAARNSSSSAGTGAPNEAPMVSIQRSPSMGTRMAARLPAGGVSMAMAKVPSRSDGDRRSTMVA